MTPFLESLSPEEESHYLRQYAMGDQKAGDILVERNLRLVAHIAKKYASPERDTEDLISIGTIGLIKAVRTFQADKGNKLATYAAKCIDNELLMMLRAEKKKAKDVSLYDPIGTDKEGNAINLFDIIESNDPDIVEEQNKKGAIRTIGKALSVLSPKEYEIICKRYGLCGRKPMTQRELAAGLGISRSYVSRIEKRALSKMKTVMAEAGFTQLP